MNDFPQMSPQHDVIGQDNQPFTVLLMMPDDMRGDEACEADWIRRVWVFGDPDYQEELLARARLSLAGIFGWDDPENGLPMADLHERCASLSPVAIYAGHLFDIRASE